MPLYNGGETVPRPFCPTIYGTKPNDLVQFDYIELGKANTGEKYVLMIREDHSEYCWLFPSPSQTADTAADGLLDWLASFGTPTSFMLDGPTHYKNESMRVLSKGLRKHHYFILPYCP